MTASWPRGWRDRIAAGLFLILTIASAVIVTWSMRQGYAVHRLTRGVGDTWFLAANGRRWFRMDERRQDVALRDIPEDLQHAFVAIEDHRFYSHVGVDPIALGRAIVRNATDGSLQGGSTLTQQLARTLFLSNRKTYGRKLHEAVLAVMIDAQLSKDQILELYLNRIYLSAGVYGVETMSRHLFGKPAKQLTLAESALIAGLARSPAGLSPWNHLEDAVARSHVVLARMRDEGFITQAQEQAARRARLRVQPYPGAIESQAGYAKDYVRQLFRDSFGGDHPPDWDVQTTFVPELQEMAERAVAEGLRRFGQPELQAALVAIDPATGNVLAMVGGRDFRLTQFNRASRSRRQPGSAFKPLLYAAALEHGFSPVSVLSDLANVPPQGPEEWSPRNAEADAPETLTLRAALFESDNRAATVLQQRVGSRTVLSLASQVGLRDMPDVPSLSLGTGLVSPLELTAAFTMFPTGGVVAQPRGIIRVLDGDGTTALDNPVRTERVISEETAFQMVSMLGDVIDRGTGSAARAQGVRFAVGGKTGTTNEFKDAWFVGFSSSVVVGVWVGFDQPRTIGRDAYGSRYALPIWSDFMRRASRLRVPQAFEPPDTLHDEPLCRVSYLKPVEGCPVYTEYFKDGDAVPGRLCPVHQGTVKQRVRRAVDGFLSGLTKRVLRGIFK
ncbi:MAG: PBP1A family penicillin-binding protein [Vicinamibacterales bacterium]